MPDTYGPPPPTFNPDTSDPLKFYQSVHDYAKKKKQYEKDYGQYNKARGFFAQGRRDLLKRQREDAQTLRSGFKQNLALALGARQAQAREGFRQAAGRAGLAGSGVEQAGLQTVAAAGQQQYAQSLGEFESRLAELQSRERAALDQGELNFVTSLYKMSVQADLEKELAQFQADIAANQQSALQLGNILNVGAQVGLNLYDYYKNKG